MNKLFDLIAKIIDADPIDVVIWLFAGLGTIAIISMIVSMVRQITG